MPRFRVMLCEPTCGAARTAVSVDSLNEARLIADALAEHSAWIEWERDPAASETALGWGRLNFTPAERAEIEAIYLHARSEMQAAGMSMERINEIVPLTEGGCVPWA